jgi:metallo-beta-lactamase class B
MRGAVLALLIAAPAAAQLDPPAWTRPTSAFPITPDIWYVGTEGLGSYLIKTRDGALLIDGTMAENAPAILRNIKAAGVDPKAIKWLLVSHAHFDHAAGNAAIIRTTGAKVAAGAGDVAALQTGISPGEVTYDAVNFSPVAVARPLRDGSIIQLGGVTLTAVATPGHTPGCTSYRMISGGKRVLFPCSLTVAGNRLVGNRRYPGIVADFRRSFTRMARERADIVLPFHPDGSFFERHRRGDNVSRPEAMAKTVKNARASFEADLAKQMASLKP